MSSANGGAAALSDDKKLALQQAEIHQSMQAMQKFMGEMKNRMERLEANVVKVQNEVGSVLTQLAEQQSSPAAMPMLGGGDAGDGQPVLAQNLALHFSTDVETMWYTDRPFPPFVVQVINTTTRQVHTAADDWEIEIHLLDGYGRYCDDKLGQNERARRVTTHKGCATVAGLRFYAVSSKNGGHFALEFETKTVQLTTLKSPNITILSCRLFHNPKATIEKLRPSDSLSMMPGIGRLYAQRFASVGVTSIAKLAEIRLGEMDSAAQQSFLESLRKDKGTMTKAKLEDYINHAREVLQRANNQRDAPAHPAMSAKRMRTHHIVPPPQPQQPQEDKKAHTAAADPLAISVKLDGVAGGTIERMMAATTDTMQPAPFIDANPDTAVMGRLAVEGVPVPVPADTNTPNNSNQKIKIDPPTVEVVEVESWAHTKEGLPSSRRSSVLSDLGDAAAVDLDGIEQFNNHNGEKEDRSKMRRRSSVSKFFDASVLGSGDKELDVKRRMSTVSAGSADHDVGDTVRRASRDSNDFSLGR